MRTEVEAGASPRLIHQAAAPSAERCVAPRSRSYGWVPVLLLAIGIVGVWRFYDVGFTTIGAFVGYLVVGVTIPGTLIWRALHRRPAPLAEDLAAGLAVGYTLEVLVYIGCRAVGLPLLVLAFPGLSVGVFAALPSLRGFWAVRGPDVTRVPALWSWCLTGAAGLVVAWSVKFFRGYGLVWPSYADPDTDSTFHLALIGEAKHHMPMRVPWVAGEPLYYHWFVYADMASTSWVTGIEPQVLLLRLSMLPMLIAFTVLVAFLARRSFGHWWTGIAAVVATLFALAPDPSGWPMYKTYTALGFSPVDDGSSLRLTTWSGPPQTFGALLFVPLLMVLPDLLRGAGRRRWLLFTLLVCGVMGAKATYLPLLLAGLVTVVVGQLIFARKLHRGALAATGITAAGVVFAQFVLFGGASQGLRWAPLTDIRTSPLAATTGFMGDPAAWHMQLILAIAIWSWVCVWAGISGYLRRARELVRPEILLLLGIGLAGLLATSLFGQSGDSQRYFLESARPCLSLAAVGGLALLVRTMTWRRGLVLVCAAVAGALTIWAISATGPQDPPTFYTAPSWWSHDWHRLGHVIREPYEITVAVAVAVTFVLCALRFFVKPLRGLTQAILVVFLAGYALATTYANLDGVVSAGLSQGWHTVADERAPIVTEGTVEAGRWLRDHSDPNDVVATNEHCLAPVTAGQCENLHFSVAAYTERRVLLEGWGFTATAHALADRTGQWDGGVVYWRPSVQRDNDAAFSHPSAASLRVLKERYRVRWLFVDESRSRPSFEGLLSPRFRSGRCVVYEL